jgi:hypothetical protein
LDQRDGLGRLLPVSLNPETVLPDGRLNLGSPSDGKPWKGIFRDVQKLLLMRCGEPHQTAAAEGEKVTPIV